MTADSVTSPPNSPPPKRVKTDNDNSITGTMAESTTTTSIPIHQPEEPPSLLVKKLSDKARLPTRGSAFAAGYDLYSSQATTVPARGKVLVDTDIAISVPAGTCTSFYFFANVPFITGKPSNPRSHTNYRPRLTHETKQTDA